jgi:hypothetical protein
VVDLLPAMAGPDSERLFHACDYHWSAEGNALAARAVLAALRAPDGPAP